MKKQYKNGTSNKDDIESLRRAIFDLHASTSKWIRAEYIREEFKEKIVWEGTVQVFDIQGHPEATRCYAWSSPIGGSTKRKFFEVLHVPPVASAKDAVRAAIVQEYRQK